MNKVLEAQLTQLTEDEIACLNSLAYIKEIQFISKTFSFIIKTIKLFYQKNSIKHRERNDPNFIFQHSYLDRSSSFPNAFYVVKKIITKLDTVI
jgi:hypothetical protein